MILLGVIGYQFALLVELTRGRSLGRTGAVRLARAEQEFRELKTEQARLLAAIEDRDQKIAAMSQIPPDDSGDQVQAGDSAEGEAIVETGRETNERPA